MKSILLSFMLLLTAMSFAQAAKYKPGLYQIDPMHTKIGFSVPHLGVSRVEGRFTQFDGTLDLKDKFIQSVFKATMEVNSINTDVVKRDDHLKSADFFDAKKFPKMMFVSKSFKGSPEKFTVQGDLTIKDVTKSVPVIGRYLGTVKDQMGNERAVFSGKATVNRKDFKINYNDVVDTVPLVGDEVEIDLVIEAIRK